MLPTIDRVLSSTRQSTSTLAARGVEDFLQRRVCGAASGQRRQRSIIGDVLNFKMNLFAKKINEGIELLHVDKLDYLKPF